MSEQRWSYTSEDCGDVVWYELQDNGKPTGLTMDFTDKSQALLEQIAAALNAAEKRDAEPNALSADMLSEDDREHLIELQRLAQIALRKQDAECACGYCEAAKLAIAWADRLLLSDKD